MSNLFQIADVTTNIDDNCGGLAPIVRLIKNGVFPIIQIGIPIILIVLGTIDLGKAVISSDEKQVKAAQSSLIKRCIYAVAIFFVTTIVSLLMSIVGTADLDDAETDNWATCWNSID